MNQYYILEGRTPVPCTDLRTWTRQFEIMNRRIELTKINGLLISTVFLGVNHSFNNSKPPLLFETIALDYTGAEIDVDRYPTWEEAEAGHLKMCKKLITKRRRPGPQIKSCNTLRRGRTARR